MANNTISRAVAESIAEKLVAKFNVEIKELESKRKKYLTDLYIKTLPKEVLETFEKYPNYFNKESSIRFDTHGFRYKYLDTEPLPFCNKNASDLFLPNKKPAITDKDYTYLWDVEVKVNALKEKKSKTYNELISTLLQLKSYKRIQEHFPEIASYLPTNTQTMALTLNLDKIRETTKCLISEDSKCMKQI